MASYTTNYNLIKPATTDFVDIADLNDNADTIDTTILAEKEAVQEWAKGTFSNPPLNINGDFKIQQRGTTFVAPSNIYTADRYKCNGSGTVTLTSDGMVITGTVTVVYIMETADNNKISGKTVTLSYSLNDVIATSTFTASSSTIMSLTITDKTLNWVKIELGSAATPFVPRPYGEELALCQRYYEVSNTFITLPALQTSRLVGFRYIVNKRETPTITISSENGTANAISRYGVSGTTYAVTGFNSSSVDGMLAIQVASNDLVVGAYYVFKYIADAEL